VSAPTTPDLTPRPRTLLLAVLAWHLVFWVLAPWLVYRMLPLDALELLGWGQEWQWGYYKHPPLGPWLGEAFVWLCGGRIESLYLLAQLALVVTLIYVWRCARLFLDPARAVLATVLLEGSYFHTYLIPNFNMNSLQLPLWAGFSFHLIRALQGQRRATGTQRRCVPRSACWPSIPVPCCCCAASRWCWPHPKVGAPCARRRRGGRHCWRWACSRRTCFGCVSTSTCRCTTCAVSIPIRRNVALAACWPSRSALPWVPC
jgi:hypothetical protein